MVIERRTDQLEEVGRRDQQERKIRRTVPSSEEGYREQAHKGREATKCDPHTGKRAKKKIAQRLKKRKGPRKGSNTLRTIAF